MSPKKVGIEWLLMSLALLVISFYFLHFSLTKYNVTLCDNTKNTSYIEKRNEMSRLLNLQRQIFGQQSCELIALQIKYGLKTGETVSSSGGWCKQESRSGGGQHKFDARLADQLSLFFAGKRVASFGDGPGDYKKFIDKTKRVLTYDAYDGAPYGPETSGGVVKYLDLTVPQYGLPRYDWIISLEVAEHIPQQYEAMYIDNIVRHARSGIVLSWAVPGQGGFSHVNNRPFTYVAETFLRRGFIHNQNASQRLRNSAVLYWLRNNINVFERQGSFMQHLDDV